MGEGTRVLYVGNLGEETASALAAAEGADGSLDVVAAQTPAEGREVLSSEFDCVVAEKATSGGDGLSFLRSVGDSYPGVPLILYGQDIDEVDVIEAVSAGVTTVVPKVGSERGPELLKARVRAAVEHQRSTRELDKYRTLVETVGDPMYVFDAEGYVEFANEAMLDFLDTTREELAGRHVSEMIPEDDYGDGTERLQRIRDDPDQAWGLYEITVFTDADERKHAECNMTPLVENGELVGSVGVFRDITERRRGREALEALHEVATTIQTEDTVEAVCEQTVVAASEILDFALCSVIIREGEWLVPYAISEDAPPDGSRPMRIDQGIAGQTFQSQEARVIEQVTDDDESEPAKESYQSAISVPIADHGVFQAVSYEPGAFDQDDVAFAELLLSHTANAIERLERRRELERQNERLEKFASVVSHDLRNPLNVASTRLDLLAEECDSEHLEAVESAHERMETLIDDLLTLASEGKSVASFETVDLAAAVQNCWETVETEDLTLSVETDLSIRADPSRLKQVLENLFRNALDHGGEGVSVTVGDLPNRSGFYVADDGPGVPEDRRRKVLESGHSTSADGTGFGLAIAAEIARAHGWEVAVTESAEGGARFEFAGVDIASESE